MMNRYMNIEIQADNNIKEREIIKMFEVYGKLTRKVYVTGLSRKIAEDYIRWHREIADFLEVRLVK